MQNKLKMKLKLHHTLLFCFLLISNLVFSQHKKDTVSIPSPFLLPKFTEGTIVFNDGKINRGLLLNYDTSLDEMQFIGPNKEILSFAQPEKVGLVKIADRQFLNYKNFFVEMLIEGNISLCLRIHQKRFSERIGAYGGTGAAASIGNYSTYTSADGNLTKLTPREAVSYKTEYLFYILHYGKIKMILTPRDLYRYFPSNKELLKQEIEKQHTTFSNIESVKNIIRWINANEIKN